MVEKTRFLKIYYLILESTSIPLAVVLILFILSGYGLITTTMEIFGFDYRVSSIIHTSRVFRILLIILTYLHMFSGFEIMIYKYFRISKIRYILKATLYVLITVSLVPIVVCEFHLH
ncbi:MAG: hypothetical protein QXP72_02320 [Desulfurococcaceae archaeon]